jgi:acetyl-CoA C-acetyltransferase
MPEVVIVSAVRTPIGRLGGALRQHTAVELGALVLAEAVRRAGIEPEEVDEVIVGHARQAGNGPNPGRLMAMKAGLPAQAPAHTVQMACVSSMKALILAYQSIALGEAQVVAVAGCEHMSSIPYLLFDVRWGRRMGDGVLVDGMYRDGFIDPLSGKHMGELAEGWAERFGIGREEQDRYALRSQQLAARAEAAGIAGRIRIPVPAKEKGAPPVAADEHARPDTTLEALSRLPPVFRRDGTVTAGNASGITDGAVAAVVMSGAAAARRSLKPLAVIRATDLYGLRPEDYGLAPAYSIQRALSKAGLRLDDVGHIEINEAFAVQVLACLRLLGIDLDERVNPYGGAIALGHPVGMSGLRVAAYAALGLSEGGARYAVASLCGNGGHAGTVVLERP